MDVIRLWTDPDARAGADPAELREHPHPAGTPELSDPVIDERIGTGPRLADLPSPACPVRAVRLMNAGS
jgi:mersacidin/lichenicidin family type 2 lantibiotic